MILSSSFLAIIIILHHPMNRTDNWLHLRKNLLLNKLISDYVERITRTTRSQLGGTIIIDSRNYEYTIDRINKETQKTVWRCRSKHKTKCKARAHTFNDLILKFSCDHNHPPPPNDLNWLNLKINSLLTKLISDFVEYISRMAHSSQGAAIIVDSRNYEYTKDRTNKASEKSVWKCRSKRKTKCKARAHTINDLILKFSSDHNHPPPSNESSWKYSHAWIN